MLAEANDMAREALSGHIALMRGKVFLGASTSVFR